MAVVLGSLVQLKGGGPPMTVTSLSDGSKKMATCVWFDNANKSNRADFPVESLEEFKEPPESA